MSTSSTLTRTLIMTQQELIRHLYPILLTLGIVGCLLNLIVFSRPQLRTNSCCIYFFAASLDHLITLIVGISPVMYALNNPDTLVESLIFCKVRGYIFQICLMLSRWFVAFACIDRYRLTSDKVHLRNFAQPKIARPAIFIIIAVWSIICSHRLIFYEIDRGFCGIVNNIPAALYHSMYVIIGGGILPAAIMIVCAFLIRGNLARKQQIRKKFSVDNQRQKKLDQQVHKILFVQVIFYIIFTIPQLCNLVFNTISITIPNRSNEHLAIEVFVAFIAELMLYLFPVTSFYLYTLTSRTFRKELMMFVRPKICRNHRVNPSVATTTTGSPLQT